jgi:hypothetical protein
MAAERLQTTGAFSCVCSQTVDCKIDDLVVVSNHDSHTRNGAMYEESWRGRGRRQVLW